jgi:glycosyltransferase involved in cell wall biosynthesis
MNILYDHQAFTMQYFGGVSKCFCNLISNLPKEIEYKISIRQSNNIHLRNSNLIDDIEDVRLDGRTFRKHFKLKGSGAVYNVLKDISLIKTAENVNKKCSIKALEKGDFDIFHPTFFETYFLDYINKKPFVVTIHDMMSELFPQYFPKNNIESDRKRLLCEKASAVVTVSEQTKKDLIRIFGVPEEKIVVIYHGGPKIQNVSSNNLSDCEYFLYVGQRDAYKNFTQLLMDFSVFASNHKDVKLICTGIPFNAKEKVLIKKLGVDQNVQYKNPSDGELLILYSNAIAFVYPSLYEGFGMPILEAFACGCPVLLNNTSCFHEIGSHGALYFDSSESSSNVPDLLEQVYSQNNDDRQTLINSGFERLKDFSWEKSSNQLAKLYNGLV